MNIPENFVQVAESDLVDLVILVFVFCRLKITENVRQFSKGLVL